MSVEYELELNFDTATFWYAIYNVSFQILNLLLSNLVDGDFILLERGIAL